MFQRLAYASVFDVIGHQRPTHGFVALRAMQKEQFIEPALSDCRTIYTPSLIGSSPERMRIAVLIQSLWCGSAPRHYRVQFRDPLSSMKAKVLSFYFLHIPAS